MIIKQSPRYGGKSFVAVIALIASSALPVKSDAFAITRGRSNRITTKPSTFHNAPAPHAPSKKVVLVPSLEEERSSTALYAEVVAPNDYAVNLPNLDWLLAYFNKASNFVSKNFFLVGMIAAVSFARLLPELGKNGSIVRPELFIGKYGVTTIFLLSGLSIKLKELANAAVNLKLNSLIQTISFGVWPFLVGLPLTKGIDFLFPGFLPAPLLDGLLILTCLPTTLNMCILLTAKAEGSGESDCIDRSISKGVPRELISMFFIFIVASALCNAVISNLAGIFITPALFMHFFGKSIELPFVDLVKKLCSKVLLPVAVGQALRATPMKDFYAKHTGFFKRFQEVMLLFLCAMAAAFAFMLTTRFKLSIQCVILGIVWNAFCNAFTSGLGLEMKHAAALLVLLPALHASSLISLSSFFHSNCFGLSTEEAKAATFCGAQKTLAFGLPLINTIFEGNMNLGKNILR